MTTDEFLEEARKAIDWFRANFPEASEWDLMKFLMAWQPEPKYGP